MMLCGSGATEAKVTIYYHGDGGKGFLGRTFNAQIMLQQAGVPYEQKGFTAELLAERGTFATPMLDVANSDGTLITCSQTVAIAETLGDLLGMTLKDPVDLAKARQLNCDAADFVAEAFAKAGKDEKWPERMAKFMSHLNNVAKMSKTAYFCNAAEPTFADFHVLHPIEMMDIGTKGECFKGSDDLKKWFDGMKETKGYKAYLEKKVKIAGSADRFA